MKELMIGAGLFMIVLNSFRGFMLGVKHEAHVELLRNLIAKKKLEEYEIARGQWQWRKAVHAHGMLLSMVTIVIGLLVPSMNCPGWFIAVMGGMLIVAPIAWSIFGWWFYKPLLGLGDILFILGILMGAAGYFFGIIRYLIHLSTLTG